MKGKERGGEEVGLLTSHSTVFATANYKVFCFLSFFLSGSMLARVYLTFPSPRAHTAFLDVRLLPYKLYYNCVCSSCRLKYLLFFFSFFFLIRKTNCLGFYILVFSFF
jgi:hypothetical protein